MKNKLLGFLKYLFFLGLGVFLVWWSLKQIPGEKWDGFKAALSGARYWLLIPVFIILCLSHILRAIRWKMLMEPLGYRPTLLNTFFAVMIGYLANLAVPRLGEVLKCTIIARYEKVPAEKLVGTIVAERAFDLVCLLLIFGLAFTLQFSQTTSYATTLLQPLFKSDTGSFSWSKVIIVLLVIGLLIFLIKVLGNKFARAKPIIVVKRIFTGIWLGIVSVKNLKQKWPFVFCTAGIWCLYLVGTWIGFQATDGSAGLGMSVAVSGLAFASIGMIATPGGIGAYALFLAKILEKNGVPYELGLANGTLQWFAQFLLIVLVGFISMGLLPYFNKYTTKNEKSRQYST